MKSKSDGSRSHLCWLWLPSSLIRVMAVRELLIGDQQCSKWNVDWKFAVVRPFFFVIKICILPSYLPFFSNRLVVPHTHRMWLYQCFLMLVLQGKRNKNKNKWDLINIRIYNGILLSHKKEWNNAIHSNLDATRDYHTKWITTRKINTIWYHLYVKSKIWHKWTYLWNRLINIENRLVIAKWKGLEEGWSGGWS